MIFLIREDILDFYKKVSMYTNYGMYKSYYETLPNDLAELCELINKQYIHRHVLYTSFLKEENNAIKKEYPWYKYRSHDDILITAPAITAELFRMDHRGFFLNREIKDKVVITCRYASILLASILKAKGYAARVRSGFASYFQPGKSIDHWIVQLYNEEEQRWINIDVDGIHIKAFNTVDMPNECFDWAAQAWLDVRSGKKDANYFVHGGHYTGLCMLAQALFFDFHSLMNDEISYLFFPTFISGEDKFYELSPDDLYELDKLATLLLHPDENFDELKYLFRNDQKLRVLNTPLLSDRDHLEIIQEKDSTFV